MCVLLCDQCAFLERDAAGFLAPAGSALQVATALSLGLKEEQHANKEVEQRMQSWCVPSFCIRYRRVCVFHKHSVHMRVQRPCPRARSQAHKQAQLTKSRHFPGIV